jgi:hypothetical protein
VQPSNHLEPSRLKPLAGSGRNLQPESRGTLPPARGLQTAGTPGRTYAGRVLSGLRDSRGRPNVRVKVLAVVVALLLAGPLTIVVVRALLALVDLLL